MAAAPRTTRISSPTGPGLAEPGLISSLSLTACMAHPPPWSALLRPARYGRGRSAASPKRGNGRGILKLLVARGGLPTGVSGGDGAGLTAAAPAPVPGRRPGFGWPPPACRRDG